MNEPSFDADGYPTEQTLDLIRKWAVVTADDAIAAMDFAGAAWSYPDRWTKEIGWRDPDWPTSPQVRYTISTGGWSGNEDVIAAIETNQMLQMLGWWSSRRGGHYEYRFIEP